MILAGFEEPEKVAEMPASLFTEKACLRTQVGTLSRMVLVFCALLVG